MSCTKQTAPLHDLDTLLKMMHIDGSHYSNNYLFSAMNGKWIIILDVEVDTDDSWLPSD